MSTQESHAEAATVLRVAAAQMTFSRTCSANLEKIRVSTERAATMGADAILFPECATTGYNRDFGTLDESTVRESLREVARIAAGNRINLLTGSPVFRRSRLFNGFLAFDRLGRLAHVYAKCQLTEIDRRWFEPGDGVSLFEIDGILATAIICHERRYPELVRLAAMAGARIVFHPNAGLDPPEVSMAKRKGQDGMPVRAFENAIYYVFANSVGPQGHGLWSAGDSKIVAPDGRIMQLADNETETIILDDLDLSRATRKYAIESLEHPRFLSSHWRRIISELETAVRANDDGFRAWYGPDVGP